MKIYQVRYELDETGWWVASIDAVAGCHTQGRTLEQTQERIREALAALVGDKHAERARFDHHVVLNKHLERLLRDMTTKKDQAMRIAAEAENAARDVAVALSKKMSLRDVGTVMGVSRQRAHQLVGETS